MNELEGLQQGRLRPLLRIVAIVAAITAGLVLGGTAAVAYWTAKGTGSGTAAVRNFTAPTVTAGTTNSGTQLYPGLTANGTSTGGNLVVTASNPNPFAVTVTVTQDTTKSVTSTNPGVAACTTPAVTFSGGNFTLAANASNVSQTLSYTVSMGTSSSSDCQGANLSVPLTTSAQSN